MSKTFYTVILSVLLLTIVVSCLQPKRPKALDIFIDTAKKRDVQLPVPESRTMTLCLGNNNKVLYFLGNQDKPLEGPAVTGYGKDSLDKTIISMIGKMKKDSDSYLIVLIKPSDKSTYQNFLKTIDILNVCKVKARAVVDITPNEVAMLKKYKAY
jgi:hypothetical protein